MAVQLMITVSMTSTAGYEAAKQIGWVATSGYLQIAAGISTVTSGYLGCRLLELFD